ncbi:MAG: metallophosphoesterase family protein [Candidatus Alcyoniella australis]|nr:metallophosphoesterase family protein [Candidatus Alcyoniella australis]
MRIGVVSDTHGVLGADVVEALRGCELIVHAGDVGSAAVLAGLEAIAPLRVIRGNHEPEELAYLPRSLEFEAAGLRFYVLHGFISMPRERARSMFGNFFRRLAERKIDVLIFGHTHIPYNRREEGMLLFNPGFAGASAEHRELGIITVENGSTAAVHVPLGQLGEERNT